MSSETSTTDNANLHQVVLEHPLRVLTPRQIGMVDLVLAELGEFGEVRLILQKSRVRFIEKLQSLDALA